MKYFRSKFFYEIYGRGQRSVPSDATMFDVDDKTEIDLASPSRALPNQKYSQDIRYNLSEVDSSPTRLILPFGQSKNAVELTVDFDKEKNIQGL